MNEVSSGEPWGPFFTNSAEPCFVIGVEGDDFILCDVNSAWERSTGLKGQATVGQSATNHLPEPFAALARQRLLECTTSGHAHEYEEQIAFPTGLRVWRTKFCPLHAAGRVTHIIAFARDITEEVHAVEALRESEARFRRLSDNAQDIIYRLHTKPEFGIEYVGRSIQRLTGYSPEEYYANSELWKQIIHPEDRAKVEQYVAHPTEHPPLLRFVHKNGAVGWLESRNVLVRDASGQLIALEGISRDVTDRIEREEEHRRLEQKLLETQKLESLGVLAGGIAHDFNNLLTGILGRVGLMRSELQRADPAQEHVEQIERAAVQAADLCRQMLAYSGKGRFLVRRLDLNDLVRETLALIQASINKSAALYVKLDPALPAVNADASQVRQLLMNLVVNASEALVDARGTITIVSRVQHVSERELKHTLFAPDLPEGRYVCLEISDTGAGMGEDTRQRIFDPFYTTKFTGRGLGLPAVLGIVRGHQGAIKVESEQGSGTTFKVYLPAVEGAGERVPRSGSGGTAYRGTGTILIVDDEEIVRSVTGRILRSFGFKVVSAADGIEGLSRFRSHENEVRAVLLDLTMPGLDGEAVFRELRALRHDLPVLLMSGYNEQDAVSRFAGKGLAGFLQKPFTVDQLLEKLRGILPS
jgi:PAS domain S-box-containing protein